MKIDNILSFLLGILVLTMISCSSDFSKYEKSGENDVEKAGLKGPVKEVISYWNGGLSRIEKYNKYGFLTSDEDYDFGKLDHKYEYKYDEYGNLIEETNIYDNGNRIYRYFYEYDENNHITKTTCTTIENGVAKKNEFRCSFENIYENGNLIKRIVRDAESTSIGNYKIEHYTLGGKLKRVQRVDDNGNLREYMAYDYYADGSLYRTYFLYSNGDVHDYWEEIYEPNSYGNYKEPMRRLHLFPEQPNNKAEQTYHYNDNRDCVYFESCGGGYNAEYKYDSHNNWIYCKRVPLTESFFSDGKGGSQSYEEEKREIKYY